MLTHVDLFSGVGGFGFAARWAGFKTVAFCEIDLYCQEIIKKNFGAITDAEIIRSQQATNGRKQKESLFVVGSKICADIRDFDGAAYRGATLLTGGFPCQPFSQAGKRRGKKDERYLWPEMH